MFKIATYLVYASVVSSLYCIVKSENNTDSVCILKDPLTQCGAFCHASLHPLYDHMANLRKQWKTINDTLHKSCGKLDQLDRVEELKAAIERKIESRHVETVDTISKELQRKFSEQAALVKTVETLLLVSQEKLSILQKIDSPESFELIGDKLFYIADHIQVPWTTAKIACELVNCRLATFDNNEQFEAIQRKLRKGVAYWIGINDRDKEGEFISDATGKAPTFVRWSEGEPGNQDDADDCGFSSI
ncbi:hypothetical protein M5D96_004943 [Drosophila gunungcola]|uniref:C-type lectin domain-containing protein n=1 Tax=Drosophila gunungcola TaxID=103775 RepID=A0A9Q0BTR7_9MUSC|nr:hypothetical protein M5D96_004943 [Drosophila gunungcola]